MYFRWGANKLWLFVPAQAVDRQVNGRAIKR
jgi:hypothetical protein